MGFNEMKKGRRKTDPAQVAAGSLCGDLDADPIEASGHRGKHSGPWRGIGPPAPQGRPIRVTAFGSCRTGKNRMQTGSWAAAVLGVILWMFSAAVFDRREPWDAPQFWTHALPAALALSFALGVVFPDRAARRGAMVMMMLVPVLALSGSGLSLLPLGLVAVAVLALPAMLAASIGGRLRRALV
jgi:hypothetical protein